MCCCCSILHICSIRQLVNRQPQYRFTVPTILMIGKQAVEALELLHSAHYVHRDIKPVLVINCVYLASRSASRSRTISPSTKSIPEGSIFSILAYVNILI